jgi:L-lactate dehydrogenase complex protein LldE
VRIALVVTCVNDALRPSTGRAVVHLLERLGHTVTFPEPQTCCGQLHLNAGYRPEGLALARPLVEVLRRDGPDAVVVPSASCAATMRHLWAQAAVDEGDGRLADDARALAPVVHELCELLVDVLGVTDVGARFPHKVAYHPTCHSLRALRLGDRPRRLLEAVEGLELVELPDADACCGFGGLFAVKNPETSVAMGRDKLRGVRASGAEVLCAADGSCLAHLGGLDPHLQIRHLAEILAGTSLPEAR